MDTLSYYFRPSFQVASGERDRGGYISVPFFSCPCGRSHGSLYVPVYGEEHSCFFPDSGEADMAEKMMKSVHHGAGRSDKGRSK